MKKVNNKANNEEYNSKMKIKSKNNKANASNGIIDNEQSKMNIRIMITDII